MHAALRPQYRLPLLSRLWALIQAATPGEWLYLGGQIGLVAAVELSDELAHAVLPTVNAVAGQAHALRVEGFESAHGFWLEPGIQRFFESTHHLLGQTIGWPQLRPIFDTLYGEGHVFITLAFALWIFFRRRALFSFIRNVFLLTNLIAVLLYEVFPLAPPRLAAGLRYDDRPYHFADAFFGGTGGLKIGFNEYAAMPSVHVAWALIVGFTVAWTARSLLLRLAGLLYPLIMLTTVIVTGNHYLSDGLGALAVVTLATLLSLLIVRRHAGGIPRFHTPLQGDTAPVSSVPSQGRSRAA